MWCKIVVTMVCNCRIINNVFRAYSVFSVKASTVMCATDRRDAVLHRHQPRAQDNCHFYTRHAITAGNSFYIIRSFLHRCKRVPDVHTDRVYRCKRVPDVHTDRVYRCKRVPDVHTDRVCRDFRKICICEEDTYLESLEDIKYSVVSMSRQFVVCPVWV